jgi:ankyrin repeat protein
MIAANGSHREIVSALLNALLARGADLNEVDVTGKTALQLVQERATGESRDEIVHLLTQAGAK